MGESLVHFTGTDDLTVCGLRTDVGGTTHVDRYGDTAGDVTCPQCLQAAEQIGRDADDENAAQSITLETYEPGPCVLAAIDCAAFQITTAGLKNQRAAEVLAPLMTTMVAAVAMAELVANGVAPYAGPDGELGEPDKAGADALSTWAAERVTSASLVALLDRMKTANHPVVSILIGRLTQ